MPIHSLQRALCAVVVAASVATAGAVLLQPADPATLQAAPDPAKLTKFPSHPVPGHPGADPDPAKNRPAWGKPEYLNYPGSIEHYRMQDQKYVFALNPFNERTLVRNFIAVEMAGARTGMKETYAEPVEYVWPLFRKPGYERTDQTRPPVPVVRLKPGGPRLNFELKGLANGLHVVRLVSAIEPKNQRDGYPLDLIVDMKINDGPGGETNHYVLRQRATENFYSLGEFCFHVEDDRAFRVDVGLHSDSKIDLLVHNVDVHYLFAELARRAGKKRSVLVTAEALKANWAKPEAEKTRLDHQQQVAKTLEALRKELPGKTDAELAAIRRERKDRALWDFMPPINSHYYIASGPVIHSRPDPVTEKDLAEKGLLPDDNSVARGWVGRKWNPKAAWRPDVVNPARAYESEWGLVDWQLPWRLVYDAPDGTREYYTLDDLRRNKPLPRLPVEVRPWGLRFEVDGEENARFFTPIAQANGTVVHRALSYLQDQMEGATYWPLRKYYLAAGVEDVARDYAMLLCRVAYDLPCYTSMHAMNEIIQGPMDTVHRCDYVHRHRETRSYQMIEWALLAKTYDYLYDYLKENQEFATALGKHIPWIKTPRDVITYLDTYVIQYGARQTMYFNYYYGQIQPEFLAAFSAYQGDAAISRPWMETLFTRTWIIFQPYAGIQDLLYQTTQRDGTYSIGSYSYTLGGPSSVKVARWIEAYLAQGGEERFNILDRKRFPRMTEFPYFLIDACVAGGHAPHIGDVGGLTQGYGAGLQGGHEMMRDGWRWTKDPRFAWCVANNIPRTAESDAEWQAVRDAAATVTRNPFLANRSRVLSDWGGILEAGTANDDFRFRSAARVRVGWGWGHSHRDSLDLGVWSMGMPMSGDHGNRPGYGFPDVTLSRLHNAVTIDGKDYEGHGWVSELTDAAGYHYLRAKALNGQTFERQTTLIERDTARAPDGLAPRKPLPKDCVLPQNYVVDVFRVVGGQVHSYNFHGPPEDDFQANVKPQELTEAEKEFLKGYKLDGQQWGGTAPETTLTATWRAGREPRTFDILNRGARKTSSPEQAMLGPCYDATGPRKFLSVHLAGQKGARFLTGEWVAASYKADDPLGEMARQAHLVRSAAAPPASSLFAAVWEPYAGESFIEHVTLEGDTADAVGPAALTVQMKDGARDLCFADATGEKERKLADGTVVRARAAYVSRDDAGLRHVALSGGNLLRTAEAELRLTYPEWTGVVREADYLNKTAVLDGALPPVVLDGAFFEVGLPADGPHQALWTSFEAVKVAASSKGRTTLTWRKDAGVYCGAVETVNRNAEAPYTAVLNMGIAPNLKAGENHQLTVVSPRTGRIWRCDAAGDNLNVYGAPVAAEDFAAGDRVMLYQFGPGTVWRVPAKWSMRRGADGIFTIETNTGFEVSFPGRRAAVSRDGTTWRDISTKGALSYLKAVESDLGDGRFLLKLER